jgi:hypothetical protein
VKVLEGLAGDGSWRRVVLTAAAAMAGRRRYVCARGGNGVLFYRRARQWGCWRASPRSKGGEGREDGSAGEAPAAMAGGASGQARAEAPRAVGHVPRWISARAARGRNDGFLGRAAVQQGGPDTRGRQRTPAAAWRRGRDASAREHSPERDGAGSI